MNITDPLVLRSDVVLAPVADLAADVRAKIEYDEGDYTVSRLHGRMTSQIIDGETASLLKIFREPTTIVEAVLRNSRELSKDPQTWLDELLPHIDTFIRSQVLIIAGTEEEKELRQLVPNGARIDDWEILHCIHLMEDAEIYRVRKDDTDGALKISRGAPGFSPSMFANEERVLRHLGGAAVPRLLGAGRHEDRPWLVIEWCEGVEAGMAAKYGSHDRRSVLELCVAIADAYSAIHEHGVIHSDVHPRNIIVAPDRSVRLIDFGLSRIEGSRDPLMPRGGMYYFFEPEYLAAGEQGWQLPSSFAGEQYALAALFYLLLTGSHYLEFRLGREDMIRQSRFDPPLPFEARGLAPWPEVEAILFRALEKDPAQRFPSVRDFADALRSALAVAPEEELSAEARAFVEEELAALEYPIAPKASVNYGAAGAALGLLRIASVRGDAKLLALAEVWRTRAALFVGRDEGWYNEEDDMPKALVGPISPYHTAAGVHATAAMIAWARGDVTAQRAATQSFIDASSIPCEEIDLTLGRCGTLLASALLLPLGSDVAEIGRRALTEVWSRIDTHPSTYLGIAHGRSGFLYATLRWCMASGDALPADIERRLDELAAMRVQRGRGAWWPRMLGGGAHDMMPGWCNGAAGHVFLWTAAYEHFRDEQYLRLAEEAAWNAWEEPLRHADLCCGSAGRAYALLNLYKRTGERAWLGRAKQLANHAARTSRETAPRAHALWKGDLGVAVLVADLESPESATMPMFE